MKDVRMGDLTYNRTDRSIWGIRHVNGISTLTRVAHPYREWDQVYSWPYGLDLYDIDISPDGTRLTGALAEVSGRQSLISMDLAGLMDGDTTYTELYDFGLSLPANFVFSDDGRYLYGASYYSGVSNVFRYDFARDSMEAVTNAVTGFFRPLPLTDDSLIVFRFTHEGFMPVKVRDSTIEDVSAIRFLGQEVVENHPVVTEWIAASPASVQLDTVQTYRGKYRPLANIGISSLYPVIEGYKVYPAVGLRLDLAEHLGFHRSHITAAYTPNNTLPADERWHVGWNYKYLNWNLRFNYNGSDFYDLFGPTRRSRKGYAAGIRYRKNLIYDRPRTMAYFISGNGYWGLERLPDYQNIPTSYDRFATLNGGLTYANPRASLGAVEYEAGHSWYLVSENTFVRRQANDRFYPHISGGLDLGLPLPIPHSALWFRSAAGYAAGDRFESFANFFFGGFGNNYVDAGSIQRYRSRYAFPGVDLNAIGGTNFGKLLVEWTLPAYHFRHIGSSRMHLSWARVSLFGTGIVTNMDDELYRRTLYDLGAQLDLRLSFISLYRFTFSFGYAVAFEKDEPTSDEFMFSLKIL
jgi:hypothetical protein